MKRSSKPSSDPNVAAWQTVREATENSSTPTPDRIREIAGQFADALAHSPGGKNPFAVALGKLGGLKGGRARAAKLSSRRRSEIARKAARALWAKRRAKKP